MIVLGPKVRAIRGPPVFEISKITWQKNETKNIRFLILSFSSINWAFWCFCFVFSCGLKDFKFWYVNCKAFGASFLYWVDFSIWYFMLRKHHEIFLATLSRLNTLTCLIGVQQILLIFENIFTNMFSFRPTLLLISEIFPS